MAELGVMIEECLQGMGMRNSHFSMVFWSKVIHPVDIAVLSSLKTHSFCLLQNFFSPESNSFFYVVFIMYQAYRFRIEN